MTNFQSSRISKKDMSNSVNSTKPKNGKKPEVKTSKAGVTAGVEEYDAKGNLVVKGRDTGLLMVCKVLKTQSYQSYSILVNRLGQPYDPNDLSYIEYSLRHARLQGGDPFRFIKVEKAQFESYMNYLKTKNKQYLKLTNEG